MIMPRAARALHLLTPWLLAVGREALRSISGRRKGDQEIFTARLPPNGEKPIHPLQRSLRETLSNIARNSEI